MSKPGESVYCGRLTKRALMGFPEGAFLMSNVTDGIGAPLVARVLPPPAIRNLFWRELRQLGADGRLARVFATAEDYRLFLMMNPVPDGPPGSPFSRVRIGNPLDHVGARLVMPSAACT